MHTIRALDYATGHNVRLESHTGLRRPLVPAPRETFSSNMIGDMFRAPMKTNTAFGCRRRRLLETTMRFLLSAYSAVWKCTAFDSTFSNARIRRRKQRHMRSSELNTTDPRSGIYTEIDIVS